MDTRGQSASGFAFLPSFFIFPGIVTHMPCFFPFFSWKEETESIECRSKGEKRMHRRQENWIFSTSYRYGHFFNLSASIFHLSLHSSPPPSLSLPLSLFPKEHYPHDRDKNLSWPEIAFGSSPLLTSKHFMSKQVKVQGTHKIAAYLKNQIHSLSKVVIFWSTEQ